MEITFSTVIGAAALIVLCCGIAFECVCRGIVNILNWHDKKNKKIDAGEY